MEGLQVSRVGTTLLRYGKVDEDALRWALDESRRTSRPILEILRQAGYITSFDVVFALMEQAAARLTATSTIARVFARMPSRVRC